MSARRTGHVTVRHCGIWRETISARQTDAGSPRNDNPISPRRHFCLLIKDAFTPGPCKYSPDCPNSPGYEKREKAMLARTEKYIKKQKAMVELITELIENGQLVLVSASSHGPSTVVPGGSMYPSPSNTIGVYFDGTYFGTLKQR